MSKHCPAAACNSSWDYAKNDLSAYTYNTDDFTTELNLDVGSFKPSPHSLYASMLL